MLVLTPIEEETWPDALAVLVMVHPIRPSEGDNNYIAVVLNATMCHMELYTSAQERGLQFPNRFADDGEDVIDAFNTMEAAMEHVVV